MTQDITQFDDIIDVRDVIEHFEELESEIENERELLADHPEEPNTPARQTRLDNIAALEEEMAPLRELLSDLAGYGGDEQWRGDWYPITLIRDSYFRDYAQELAEDIGAVNADAQWPNNCIDWDQAARELQIDYTSVEFGGVTYWTR